MIWILSFFIFGFEAGLITSVLGMAILMPFDPFAPFGPLMKFVATIPLIIIPFLVSKIRKLRLSNEFTLKIKNMAINWGFGVILRLVLMIPLNILLIATIFAPYIVLEDTTCQSS